MELNLVIFSLFLSASFFFASAADNLERKAYIVYMGNALESKSLAVEHHHNLLLEVIQDEEVARQSRIHSYGKSFNAFAAYLLPDEAQKLQENENVVSIFPSTTVKLHTTSSWDFMDMPLSVERNSRNESNIIVGLLDTGINMDSPSFNDKGFGPPPSKWKGVCEGGLKFSGCNNKVIGARLYNLVNLKGNDTKSVTDYDGHGSHTASTAAGVAVEDASLYGIGRGTARGGVPTARIAIYKVCHGVCTDLDIFAGLDDAIDDGVDVLSISLGGHKTAYFNDVISIGSFHAMKKGILTSAAAGNDGPDLSTLINGAPWILTVGASLQGRQFKAPVAIGNRTDIMGIALNTFSLNNTYPLILEQRESSKRVVKENEMRGKILFINGARKLDDFEIVKNMSGVGLIYRYKSAPNFGKRAAIVPYAAVDSSTAEYIANYISSTNNPVASINKSIDIQDTSAPFMASYSSRGPDNITLSIIKPDVVAPGVDILAAYSKYSTISDSRMDNRFSEYNVNHGTSMACPHAAGAAAYIKSFHPDWSTTAIKSALMTTAYEIKIKDEHAEFSYGAGHINPTKAVWPGLVYDLEIKDYVGFLCSLGYSGKNIEKIIDEGGVNCSSIPELGGEDDLNYPSMLVMQKNATSNISAVFNRSVKNVGDQANATYKANVTTLSADVQIRVTPDTLVFKQVNEVISFTVEVKGPPLKDLNDSVISSSLVWTDSIHKVRSPILIFPEYKLEKKKP